MRWLGQHLRRPRLSWRRLEVFGAVALLAIFVVQGYAANGQLKRKAVATWAVSTNHVKSPVISVANAAPGDSGTGTVRVQNVGKKPGRILVTYQGMQRSQLDSALQVSIYDKTAKQCIWPLPPKPKRVRRKRKIVLVYQTVNPCRTLAPWSAKLHNKPVVPRGWKPLTKAGRPTPKKQLAWKRKERHVLIVSWKLPLTADNSYQGQTSSFRLTWKATK